MNVSTRFRTLGVTLGVISSLFVASFAFASAYEYIKGLNFPEVVQSGHSVTTTWDVRTTGSFYEYRSLYYSTSSSPYVWNEWTDCRREGTVTTEIMDTCTSATFPTVPTTSTAYVRASTNYSGCGTWTPTPDETNCGGTYTVTTTVTP